MVGPERNSEPPIFRGADVCSSSSSVLAFCVLLIFRRPRVFFPADLSCFGHHLLFCSPFSLAEDVSIERPSGLSLAFAAEAPAPLAR